MTFPNGLRALNHADFRRFFLAQMVALVCGWMQTVAQSWLVLQLTGSPLRLGLIGTLQFGPILLFSVVTGAVADRLPKRRVLVVTQLTLAMLALVLAALVGSGHVRYWHVGVVAVLAGLAQTFDSPARQSFLADLVGNTPEARVSHRLLELVETLHGQHRARCAGSPSRGASRAEFCHMSAPMSGSSRAAVSSPARGSHHGAWSTST